jgi:hypothetical protein
LEKSYRRMPVAWIFFAFSNGYRHTPMPCVFSAPDIHLCHEFLLHLVNGYRRTPMPCVFFTAPDIHLCHVIFYLVKAIDIHLCHMFFCYGSRHTPVPCFFLYLVKAIDIHLCHVFFTAPDIHLCHVFCCF